MSSIPLCSRGIGGWTCSGSSKAVSFACAPMVSGTGFKAFGDNSTVYRHFQHWRGLAIFERLWAALVAQCEAWQGVDWQRQAVDTALGKARLGRDLVGRHPPPGEKGE